MKQSLKRRLFGICIIFVLFNNISAVEIGLKGGGLLNRSSSGNSTPGLMLGWYMKYYISDKFCLQSELQFNRLKHRDVIVSEDHGQGSLTNNYLVVPVTCSYHIYRRLQIQGGIGVAVLCNSKGKSDRGGSTMSVELDENTSKSQFLVNVGMEYETKFGIFWGSRYYYYPAKRSNNNYSDLNLDKYVQLYIGYTF